MMAMRSAACAESAVEKAKRPPMAAAIAMRRENFVIYFLPLAMKTWSGYPLNARSNLVSLENAFPVVAHQHGLAEFDRLVAGIGEHALRLAEDDGAQHIHMSQKEVA